MRGRLAGDRAAQGRAGGEQPECERAEYGTLSQAVMRFGHLSPVDAWAALRRNLRNGTPEAW
ncbi:hypothetical protein Cs7R123_47080 [Catellatospora sp. TT07R-123]|nr:hypothetical protein Cs7R123_47080 [Catellatospora sp. TT07R-123]